MQKRKMLSMIAFMLVVAGSAMILSGCFNKEEAEPALTPVNETTVEKPNEATVEKPVEETTKPVEETTVEKPVEEVPAVEDTKEKDQENSLVKDAFMNKAIEYCGKYRTLDDGIATADFKALVDEYKSITTDMDRDTTKAFNQAMDNTLGNGCQKAQWDMANMERLAEQIRRGDFTTAKEKAEITAEYNKKFTDKDVLKAKALLMTSKTKEKILASIVEKNPDLNPFYLIYRNRYNWNKLAVAGSWFKPKDLEKEFVLNLQSKFNNLLKAHNLTQEDAAKSIYEHYGVKDIDGLVKNIEDQYVEMNKAYKLDRIIPETTFTKAERKKIFADEASLEAFLEPLKSESNWEEIKGKINEFRTKIYYLVYLGMDKELDSEHTRVKVMNNGGAIQNLFRVSRYINEPMKIHLEDKTK